MTGLLITFEGVEGAGKTTQIERSRHWLQGRLPSDRSIVVTREPGGTKLGQQLRHLLLETGQPTAIAELLLYSADRAQHVEQTLKPALKRGAIILCDRYTDSTIAYQGYGRGLDIKLIENLNRIATGGLKSHITFWLDIDVEMGLKRARERGKGSDRIEGSEVAFHQRVREGFARLAEKESDRIIRIDAHLPIAEVQGQIQNALEQFLV